MRLQFFPSRQIGWYMARLFLVRTFAVLLMLVLVLQTLDLLGESGKILSVAGNSEGDLWRYVGMRAPQIIARLRDADPDIAPKTVLTLLHKWSQPGGALVKTGERGAYRYRVREGSTM